VQPWLYGYDAIEEAEKAFSSYYFTNSVDEKRDTVAAVDMISIES
jgi:hypothetical protein